MDADSLTAIYIGEPIRYIYFKLHEHLPARPKKTTDDSLVIFGDTLETKVNNANVTAPAKFVIIARHAAA